MLKARKQEETHFVLCCLQGEGDWRCCCRKIPETREEQSSAGSSDSPVTDSVCFCCSSGWTVRVSSQLSPGDRVPGRGRPGDQVTDEISSLDQ